MRPGFGAHHQRAADRGDAGEQQRRYCVNRPAAPRRRGLRLRGLIVLSGPLGLVGPAHGGFLRPVFLGAVIGRRFGKMLLFAGSALPVVRRRLRMKMLFFGEIGLMRRMQRRMLALLLAQVGNRRLGAKQGFEGIFALRGALAADQAGQFGQWIGPDARRLRRRRGGAQAAFELVQFYARLKLRGILSHGAPSQIQTTGTRSPWLRPGMAPNRVTNCKTRSNSSAHLFRRSNT